MRRSAASRAREQLGQGFSIDRRERFKLGLTERLAARKPAPG
jgi:hypothetical protein